MTDTKPLRILVFAGSATEARGWANDNHVRPRDYLYVSSAKVLRGLDGNQWARAFLGSFHGRRDKDQILEDLAIVDATRTP